ncbi:PIN domain-containing protein [Phragmitibacter flavus]|uniref:Ribonuclease VapC n=1 Tax=Phragmitibacter flavus TaxID=2576071 RepID=A0A5R8KJS6_9BACT|nr:TA system VapC family ribonuclease toxin [Phragmitibacter flavus]TLD72578.1 PIN domain-containing protein [Phragmitibacter flavus]
MPTSLFDSSAWVAAVFPTHPFHARAQAALAAATAEEPAVFCRATQVSFLRLITTPQLLRHYDAAHMTNRSALTQLQMLLSRPEIAEIEEPPGTAALWQKLAMHDTASPKVWMDAYLAAFAIKGGLHFVTLDGDFKSYQPHGLQLALLNP